MSILIVDNDSQSATQMQQLFKRAKLGSQIVNQGVDGRDFAKLYEYDLIVLTLNLPNIKELQVLSELRQAGVDTPIIIVSNNGDIAYKLSAYDMGADDYLTKPFDELELLAKAKVAIRRSHNLTQKTIQLGNLHVDLDSRTVAVEGEPVQLSHQEYLVFEFLALRQGKLVTKEVFLNYLYAGQDSPLDKMITVLVCTLRKKLRCATDGQEFIQTVWGRGYLIPRIIPAQ